MADLFTEREQAAVGLLASTSLLMEKVASQKFDEIDIPLKDRRHYVQKIAELNQRIGSEKGSTDEKVISVLKEADEIGRKAGEVLSEVKRISFKSLRVAEKSKSHLLKTHMVESRGQRLDAKG